MIKYLKINIFIFIFWLFVLGFLISRHTPWRDEFQSYLVSTRTTSWSQFFEAVRYERNPPLHYLLQKGLHALNLNLQPTTEIRFVTVPFTIGVSIVLILFDLQPLIYFGILFSPYLLREQGIISRCYPIGTFFILLASYFYKKKNTLLFGICLILASYVHLIFTLAAFGWIVFYVIQKKIPLKLFLMCFIAILFSLLLQIPPSDTAFLSSIPIKKLGLFFQTISVYAQSLLCAEWKYPFRWNKFPISVGVGFLIGCYLLNKEYKNKTLLLVSCTLLPALFVVTAYSRYSRYCGAFFLIWFSTHYLNSTLIHYKNLLKFFTFNAVLSTIFWIYSWQPWLNTPKFNFSDSTNLAQYELLKKNDIIISNDDAIIFPIMALTNKKLFHVPRNKFLMYPFFSKKEYIIKTGEWCAKNFEDFVISNKYSRIFWIAQQNTRLPKSCQTYLDNKIIYESTTPCINNECYKIYIVAR